MESITKHSRSISSGEPSSYLNSQGADLAVPSKGASTRQEPHSRQPWPEWAAAFPQVEVEILTSIWPDRT